MQLIRRFGETFLLRASCAPAGADKILYVEGRAIFSELMIQSVRKLP